MSAHALILGAALGAGVLCALRGVAILADKARPEAARRQGFWWLNGGLALIAISVFVFSRGAG